MNVVVVIEGREAVPVRAIPFLTDWNFLYPDVLAETLAGTGGETQSLFGELHAYRREGGKVIGIPERWWASFAVRKLTALNEQIKAAEPSHEVGYQQWRDESLAKLRGGAFVWKDELDAFHRSNWDRRARVLTASFSQDDEGEPLPPLDREIYELLMASRRRLESWRELEFSPWIVGSMCALVMDGFEPEQAAKLGNWLGSEKEFTEVSDLFNRIAAVNLDIEYWETRDDTRASDAKVKRDALLPLYAERDLQEQRKRELRGDYTDSYPAPQATTLSLAPVEDESASDASERPVQRSAAQDAAILAAIRAAGFNPLALPKNETGKPGPKAAVRQAMNGKPLFVGKTVFNKAWERLSARGDIVTSSYPTR